MGFKLEKVVPWGRSFEEYCAMFTLTAEDLKQSILGVGDGPASFNAELTLLGGRVISADPVYAFSTEQIRDRIAVIYDDMIIQVSKNSENLRLDKFGSAELLGLARKKAMDRFLIDFEQGKQQKRYLNLELPELGFSDAQFDLALCSHLLFLYSKQLELEFHFQAVKELCRVAKEVRIFPLLDLSHQTSTFLSPILNSLEQAGFQAKIEQVDYEFQIGANHMLKISQPS